MYFLTRIMLGIFILSVSLSATQASDFKPLNGKQLKVVIHVTESHGGHYRAALNYAHILLDTYGKKNLILEVVANGPGIGLVNAKNKYTGNVKGLIRDGIRFSACNTTVKFMREHRELPIIEHVSFVPTGVTRVIELQRQGYLYLRP